MINGDIVRVKPAKCDGKPFYGFYCGELKSDGRRLVLVKKEFRGPWVAYPQKRVESIGINIYSR